MASNETEINVCRYANFDRARGRRISELMLQRGLRLNCQLCYDIGVSESTLSRWRSGYPLSLENAIALSLKLRVALDYMLTGRTTKPEAAKLTSQLAAIVELYSHLNPENRVVSDHVLRRLAGRPIAEHGGPEPHQRPTKSARKDFFSAAPGEIRTASHCLTPPAAAESKPHDVRGKIRHA